MRVPLNLRNIVVFLGHHGQKNGKFDGTFRASGTGFVLYHEGMMYIVTAGHVAEGFGDDPFSIRINRVDGQRAVFPIDLDSSAVLADGISVQQDPLIRWFGHEESCADVAVLPFVHNLPAEGFEAEALMTGVGFVDLQDPVDDADCGDMCHVIGLFSMRSGESRNIAVVHTGHLAALADTEELIPTSARRGHTRLVEGHMVEISNLQGLSGAPVFVRGEVEMSFDTPKGSSGRVLLHKAPLRLLGVWQGSWDTNLLDPRQRAPVGMGVVTPAYRLLELLDSEAVVENRRRWLGSQKAAKPD